MKKFLLLIFFFVSLRLSAQTNVYHPFPDSNAVWRESTTWLAALPNCFVFNDYQHFILGDTTIGNKQYHRVFRAGHQYSSGCSSPPPSYYYNNYFGAIRQDTFLRKVFFVENNSSIDTLLYDFNLSIGDTLPLTPFNNSKDKFVQTIDSVLVGATYRKRFWVSDVWGDSAYCAIVEGIGSTKGLFMLSPTFNPDYQDLDCFMQNGKPQYPDTINCSIVPVSIEEYQEDVSINISPNPSTGIFTINSSEKFQYFIYDVFSREVFQETKLIQSAILDLSSYSKGIYFVRIKSNEKIVARKIILQ